MIRKINKINKIIKKVKKNPLLRYVNEIFILKCIFFVTKRTLCSNTSIMQRIIKTDVVIENNVLFRHTKKKNVNIR